MSSEQFPAYGPAPLRSALKADDEGDRTPPVSGSLKAVQIAEPVEEYFVDDAESGQASKLFRVGSSSKRMSGKPVSSSRSSISEQSPALRPQDDPSLATSRAARQDNNRQYYSEKLLAQVSDWLDHERRKASRRKKRTHLHHHHAPRRSSTSPPEDAASRKGRDDDTGAAPANRERSDSVDSQSSDVSLDRLQRIVEDSMSSMGLTAVPHFSPRPPRHNKLKRRGSLRAASSDTEYTEGDVVVPSCDAWLDNSKTLVYSGTALSNEEPEAAATRVAKEKEVWLVFKNEIIRIAHTLRLKGWRRVPLGDGHRIWVERLSGALTNAVYVVTPPADIPEIEGKKMPPKILLRIYGPQVEHLIDRDNELKVLQRLARKKIGPRLLGTFKNGRFEQFFNAITLRPSDLREPDTMKQIAKRMRELHDGIDLLPSERDAGPGIWKNWDQWLDNVGRIVQFLDKDLHNVPEGPRASSVVHAWKANGHVCGAPWPQFLAAVVKFRAYLDSFYKSPKAIRESLVFAHADTQYGNILRIRPDDEKSPLLQAANKHKQLIVIDFEYAAANTPGLEFANHFTEWTYNYHDPVTSYACNVERYPTPEEQHRFIKAYVDHRPQFPALGTPRILPQDVTAANTAANAGTGEAVGTPALLPTASSSSIVEFMLDARAPAGGWTAAERAREEQSDAQVRELMESTRLWRTANSAMWAAWGVVQAKIPGLDEANRPVSPEVAERAEAEMGVDEFDYLSYTQSRAFFFWGDCVQHGIVTVDELPEMLRRNLKTVDY
ncbi:choline kinase [Cordyceps fumosorosea ARSEF 2679]|uniref:Choline kinase n=1 Tax=Cordyceps fumosorosea (strain ARSEF 2679) TaxID=1081104 RepID=A0A167TJ41_CORFA|nr:choline kinase [Cordyceps fumosorosea ARSEF 2679]OAA60649.1 choline kinase [Cordyceps fumosorosea ARSEF 2679]